MRTIEFLKNNKLPVESTLEWLSINSAYCDCEVLTNIEDKISEI